jgi:hypothetical protein
MRSRRVGTKGAQKRRADGTVAHAFELDDAPQFERYVLITATRAFWVEPVIESAVQLATDPHRAERAPVPLDRELRQVSLVITKEPRP